MNTSIKLALAAVAVAAAATSAQAGYTKGEFLVGFTSGSGNDTIIDIGPVGSLFNGETFSVGTGLAAGANGGWGVAGLKTVGASGFLWTSSPDSTLASQGLDVSGWPSGGVAGIGSLGFGINLPGTRSWTVDAANSRSWNQQANQPLANASSTAWESNLGFVPSVLQGDKAYFYAADANANTVTYGGYFSYDSVGGILTFTAVPEPATYGVLAGLGLLALAVRRQVVSA